MNAEIAEMEAGLDAAWNVVNQSGGFGHMIRSAAAFHAELEKIAQEREGRFHIGLEDDARSWGIRAKQTKDDQRGIAYPHHVGAAMAGGAATGAMGGAIAGGPMLLRALTETGRKQALADAVGDVKIIGSSLATGAAKAAEKVPMSKLRELATEVFTSSTGNLGQSTAALDLLNGIGSSVGTTLGALDNPEVYALIGRRLAGAAKGAGTGAVAGGAIMLLRNAMNYELSKGLTNVSGGEGKGKGSSKRKHAADMVSPEAQQAIIAAAQGSQAPQAPPPGAADPDDPVAALDLESIAAWLEQGGDLNELVGELAKRGLDTTDIGRVLLAIGVPEADVGAIVQQLGGRDPTMQQQAPQQAQQMAAAQQTQMPPEAAMQAPQPPGMQAPGGYDATEVADTDDEEAGTSPVAQIIGHEVQTTSQRRARSVPIVQAPGGYVFRPDLLKFVPDMRQPGWMPPPVAAQAQNNSGWHAQGAQEQQAQQVAQEAQQEAQQIHATQQQQIQQQQQQQMVEAEAMRAHRRRLMQAAAREGAIPGVPGRPEEGAERAAVQIQIKK